jgi:AmiR/NasT family two-component response regulator
MTFESQVSALQKTIRGLEEDLHSAIVIEQARGVLRERFRLSLDDSLALLEYAAREKRTDSRVVAEEVVFSKTTPSEILDGLIRPAAWRREERFTTPD